MLSMESQKAWGTCVFVAIHGSKKSNLLPLDAWLGIPASAGMCRKPECTAFHTSGGRNGAECLIKTHTCPEPDLRSARNVRIFVRKCTDMCGIWPDGGQICAEFMAGKEGKGWLGDFGRNGAEMPFRANT